MADGDLDRNEEATPYKLRKARQQGQVPKSTDVVSTTVLIVAVVYLTWQGAGAAQAQFGFDQKLLLQAGRVDPSGGALWPLVATSIRGLLAWEAPLLACLVLAAILGNILQTGPVLSFDPITADFDRLNPANGLKKVLSVRTLFDTARACSKLALLLGVAYYALNTLVDQFYALSALSPAATLKALLDDLSSLGLKMAMVLALIALIDLIVSRREFAKKMRMSKRELKDEHKNREGDPRIRSRMRELRREMLKKSQSLSQTKNADVLLTNPTHVAVALRYVHGEMESPQVVAKGAGHLAAAMRQIAARHRIPVVQSPTLARRLFRDLDVQHHIPPELFSDVARIIVWVFAMRDRQQGPAQEAGV